MSAITVAVAVQRMQVIGSKGLGRREHSAGGQAVGGSWDVTFCTGYNVSLICVPVPPISSSTMPILGLTRPDELSG